MKITKIIILTLTIILLNGCGESDIFEKYNVKNKYGLAKLVSEDTTLEIEVMRIYIYQIKDFAYMKYDTDAEAEKIFKPYIKKVKSENGKFLFNHITTKYLSKKLSSKELQDILETENIEEKIEKLQSYLKNHIKFVVEKIITTNIEELKTLLKE